MLDNQPAARAALAAAGREAICNAFSLSIPKTSHGSRKDDAPRFVSCSIDVASVLKERLFSTWTVILTSATITPRLASRLGAPAEEVDEIDVGSPFDYDGNALLYCAAHLPDRRSPNAEAAIHEELAALIEAAGGRTLALFTSHGAMSRAAEALRGRIGFPLLVQGELAKPALVSRFADDSSTCLFATMGFWQGVDVPGSTLSLVVIDRISFPRPDDPLIAARRERAGERGILFDRPAEGGDLAFTRGRPAISLGERPWRRRRVGSCASPPLRTAGSS